MKRRFAIPAAIALTAHALLFLGLGKPPVPVDPTPKVIKIDDTKKTDDDFFEKAIELTRAEIVDPSTAPEKSGGGDPVDNPPSGPDVPYFGPLDNVIFTLDPVPVDSGHGKVVPSIRYRRGDGDGSGFGDVAVSVKLLDNPPRTRFQKAPVYPFAMKTSGMTGTVWVEFMVDEAGRVHDVRVLKSTHPDFEDATCAAVSMWKFEPGKRKGNPVCFRMSLPVVFSLSD